MGGTFRRRIDELINATGEGKLVGAVTVSQIYAHYQWAHPEFNHPDGGEAFYLDLYRHLNDYMARLARSAITAEGSDIEEVMAECMEHLSDDVFIRAPWEFGDLRNSGHPTVKSDGELIYDRPPRAARQTEQELEEKARLRNQFDPDRYTKTGAHAHHSTPAAHASFLARESSRGHQ